MKRYFKFAAVCAAFVLSVAMCAFAGSSDQFSGPLTGVANSTISGSFSYNSSTEQLTGVTLSFTSAILGSGIADPGSLQGTKNSNGLWTFQWWGFASDGDLVIYDATLNANGTFQVSGDVDNLQNQKYGGFNMAVPEGSSALAYLLLSAGAIFGGIFMSGKNRRPIPNA
jgi:hypothetical protein